MLFCVIALFLGVRYWACAVGVGKWLDISMVWVFGGGLQDV